MKRIFALTAALCLALCLCACGAKDDTGTSDPVEPTYDGYITEGSAALDDGDYDGARESFAAAIDMDETQSEAYFGLYEAYMGLEDIESAEQALTDGVDATGNDDLQRILTSLTDPDAESGATEESK